MVRLLGKKISKFLFSVGSLCSVISPAFANHSPLPKQARVPGGVAIIDLEVNSTEPPVVHYLGNRTLVMPDPKKPKHWITVVGIPLEATLGINHIEISSQDKDIIKKSFVVKPKQYRIERLNIPDKRKVEPLPEDLALIEKEYLETIATYAVWQDQAVSSLLLPIPTQGRKSSPFGLQRIMNNIPKNPHSGLDIAAPSGTKVICPKDGTVINIGNYFYSGNIVFVDHGQGFITSYCHLSSVAVSKGQVLRKGELIGAVGKTGRATGPHLHWSISLNGVRVDPELFIHGRNS